MTFANGVEAIRQHRRLAVRRGIIATNDLGGVNRRPESTVSDSDVALPPFRSFAVVSRAMLDGYRELVGEGLPPGTVAFAMLGATVNLYEMFGMTNSLPDTLRAIADRIEHGGALS